jgi:hypothetical protein
VSGLVRAKTDNREQRKDLKAKLLISTQQTDKSETPLHVCDRRLDWLLFPFMGWRKMYLGFMVCWTIAVAICRADAIDPLSEEPFSIFIGQLNVFSAQPTLRALRDLRAACSRLPVRDLKTGQIGDGYPLDRDSKLRCMLRFVATMDKLVQDTLPRAYLNVWVPGVPIAGMNPGDVPDPAVRSKYIAAINSNNQAIQIVNFQTRLKQTRDVMVRLEIPRYLEYSGRMTSAAHLQQIISGELYGDDRAKEAIKSLSGAAAAH